MNRREALRIATALLGGIVSPTLASAIAADASPNAHSSKVFSITQFKQVSLLAELIIPTTNTPGAISAGVPQFIAMMVGDWYTDTERQIFFTGLADLNSWCQSQFQRDIHQCDSVQLTQALTEAEREAMVYKANVAASMQLSMGVSDQNAPFFSKIKELTVLGYFTSEVGVTQSLAYNPMPMEYKGDIPFVEGDKQWAPY